MFTKVFGALPGYNFDIYFTSEKCDGTNGCWPAVSSAALRVPGVNATEGKNGTDAMKLPMHRARQL